MLDHDLIVSVEVLDLGVWRVSNVDELIEHHRVGGGSRFCVHLEEAKVEFLEGRV